MISPTGLAVIAMVIATGSSPAPGAPPPAFAMGQTWTCGSNPARPYFVVIGRIESYGGGRRAALISIIDPTAIYFEGSPFQAIDTESLSQTCGMLAPDSLPLARGFGRAEAYWRRSVLARVSGVSAMSLARTYEAGRDNPPPPGSYRPLAPGDRFEGMIVECNLSPPDDARPVEEATPHCLAFEPDP